MDQLQLDNAHENAVNYKCPGAYFCTVAATYYESEERIAICERCWIRVYSEFEAEYIK